MGEGGWGDGYTGDSYQRTGGGREGGKELRGGMINKTVFPTHQAHSLAFPFVSPGVLDPCLGCGVLLQPLGSVTGFDIGFGFYYFCVV